MTNSHITLRKFRFEINWDGVTPEWERNRENITKHETKKSNNCLLDKDQCVNNNLCVSLWLDGLIILGAKAMHETNVKKIEIKRCLIVKNAGKQIKYKTICFFFSSSFFVCGFGCFWAFFFSVSAQYKSDQIN